LNNCNSKGAVAWCSFFWGANEEIFGHSPKYAFQYSTKGVENRVVTKPVIVCKYNKARKKNYDGYNS